MVIGCLEQRNPAFYHVVYLYKIVGVSGSRGSFCERMVEEDKRWLIKLSREEEGSRRKGKDDVCLVTRYTPARHIYLDTFDEARFRNMSVSLSIWNDLVSMLLVRVSVFFPDLDNSSLSVSSYSSFGVTLLTSMPVIFDVTKRRLSTTKLFIIQQANKGFS